MAPVEPGPALSIIKNNMEISITGVGAATPLGCDYRTIANNLLAGTSGIRRISRFAVEDHLSQIGGIVERIPTPAGWNEDEFIRLSRIDQLAFWCCATALQDAGWWDRRSAVRVGLVLGTTAEWTTAWEWDSQAGGRQIYEPQQHLPTLVQRTSQALAISGPVLTLLAACASGNYALFLARQWLRLGWVDVCLAGACDMALTPVSLAGFGNLRALSRRNDDPQRASRPFDRNRDGFVVSEGGAVFVLEPLTSARSRNAKIYARVAGFGASSDAFHMVIPNSDPSAAAKAMHQALADARINPDQVDYVNAHATGTVVGDQAEARVLELVFGDVLLKVPVSSTKSMTGHLLTGAAAVEALACIVAMEHQAVPPTINLDEPDPECRLCHVPHHALPHPVRVAVSNSFGFGGSNTCVVLLIGE